MIDVDIRDRRNNALLEFSFTNAQEANAFFFAKIAKKNSAGDYVVNIRMDNEKKEDI